MRGRSRSTSGSTKYLSTLAMAFALVMGIACYSSCGKPDEPTPVNPVNPDPPTPPADKDTKVPEITLKLSEINVYGGKVVTIEAGKLTIGETEAATWTDDKSAADKCTVVLSFTEAGTKATTEATTQAETGTDNAPDTKAETKAGTTIKSGDTLDKAGTLTLSVTDEAGNKAEKGITLTDQIVFGLESLKNLDLQIDKEVGLMDGITTAEGWSIAKVEVETVGSTNGSSGTEGSRTEVPAPYKYTPTETGTIRIVITITDGSGRTAEFKSEDFTVKPISYNAVIPAKAESMYQKFNTTDDRAFKRRGAYETKALAQSLKNRNACKVLIFCEGVYTQGETDIHEWRGGAGDGHGEKVYRNIKEGSGDTNDILATRGTRIDVKNNINNSSLKDQPIIITTSKETLGQETVKELLDSPKYQSFVNLGNKKNILIYAASGNVEKNGNYSLHTSITNKSDFPGGHYTQEAATDTDNGIIAVEYGISKNISKHGVYEGNRKTTSCAFISKDYHIIPRNCVEYPGENYNNPEDWTKNMTSQAAPAAAAMARNVYDICHPLGIIENLQDTRFLMEKYANKVPSTREDIAEDGTIIEDVPNGYVYTMNLLALIDNEIFPAIEKKCVSENGEFTVLYTYDGLRLAYQGAGVEYQDSDGNWYDTNGINPKVYVDKPQRINYALRNKYGNKGGITIYCMVPDGVLDYGDRKGGYIVKKENADIPTG